LSHNEAIDELILEGAKCLMARATNARGLEAPALTQRMRAGVEKYVLKGAPTAADKEINGF